METGNVLNQEMGYPENSTSYISTTIPTVDEFDLNFFTPMQQSHSYTISQTPVPTNTNNQSGVPRIVFLHQPAEKFRLRYLSDSGQHGSLSAQDSREGHKLYPSVQIENVCGSVTVRVRLYTYDPDPTTSTRHQHPALRLKECMGRRRPLCNDQQSEVMKLKEEVMYTFHQGQHHYCKLSNLSIFRLTKGNLMELGKSGSEANRVLQDYSKKDACLCVEVLAEHGTTVIAHVFSNRIINSRMMSSPKIKHLSSTTFDMDGGQELTILTSKFEKGDIVVRVDDHNGWTAECSEVYLHNQYAIVCRTPPYKGERREPEVMANVFLYRPSDGEKSTKVSLKYLLPNNQDGVKKRKHACIEKYPAVSFAPSDVVQEQNQPSHKLFNSYQLKSHEILSPAGYHQLPNNEAYMDEASRSLPQSQYQMDAQNTSITEMTPEWCNHQTKFNSIEYSGTNCQNITSALIVDAQNAFAEGLNTNPQRIIMPAGSPNNNDLESQGIIPMGQLEFIGPGLAASDRDLDMCFTTEYMPSNIQFDCYPNEDTKPPGKECVNHPHMDSVLAQIQDLSLTKSQDAKGDYNNKDRDDCNDKQLEESEQNIIGPLEKASDQESTHSRKIKPSSTERRHSDKNPKEYDSVKCQREEERTTIDREEVDINDLDDDGYSALHLAVVSGSECSVKHLLVAGADVNLRTGRSGDTPLHMAINLNHMPILNILLDKEAADLFIMNYAGDTALDLISEGHPAATVIKQHKNTRDLEWCPKDEDSDTEDE